MQKILVAVLWWFAPCIGLMVEAEVAEAFGVSIEGYFSQDDDVALLNFVTSPTAKFLDVFTYGWENGGFDPIATVFGADGSELAYDDDVGVIIPGEGELLDAGIRMGIEPGPLTIAITQWPNFARGPNLADGFLGEGGGNFNGGFFDLKSFTQRTGFWGVQVLVATDELFEVSWDYFDVDFTSDLARIDLVGFGSVNFLSIPSGGSHYEIGVPSSFAMGATEGFTVFGLDEEGNPVLSLPNGIELDGLDFAALFPGFTPEDLLADPNGFFSDPAVRTLLGTPFPAMGSSEVNGVDVFSFDKVTGAPSWFGSGGMAAVSMPEPSTGVLMSLGCWLLRLAAKNPRRPGDSKRDRP